MEDKKYVLLSTDEYYEASDGEAHETTGAAIIDKLPNVVYSELFMDYFACYKVYNINNISLSKEVSFTHSNNDTFIYGNEFELPQLSGSDNSNGRGIYEVDSETAELLEGIYAKGKNDLDEIEDEINTLLVKHKKISLMANRSIADIITTKGRKLSNEELKSNVE